MKRTTFRCRPIPLACAFVALSVPSFAFATPLSLTQVPAGNGGREPAPNVVISVDDSGSMGWDIDTDASTSDSSRKKMTLLKNSLKNVFGNGTANSGMIPDNRIRLAWQAMHNNGGADGADSLTAGATNSIKPFQGAHRTAFNTFVDSLTSSSGTPSLRMMRQAFNYGRTAAGANSPWNTNPGSSTTEYLSCRRMYHVFLTDGAWNSQSNTNDAISSSGKGDSKTTTLPDNTEYSITSNNTRVYRDSFGDGVANSAATLADWAFKSWATDLQDGTSSTRTMTNNVRPLIRKVGNETFSTSTCSAASNCNVTPEFWNPRNNPATWQHITTYTIGFGLGAVNWPYRKVSPSDGNYYTSTTAAEINARVTPADWDYNNTGLDPYGGDLARLIQGELQWPDVKPGDTSANSNEQAQRTTDLWHAAVNGRGKYFPVKTADGLTAAFQDILNTVIADTSTPLVSIATSSSYLRSGLSAYIAGYNADKYAGSFSARPIDSTTGNIGATETWNAATRLDAISASDLASRLVLSYNGTSGINWSVAFSSLPSAHQTALKTNSSGGTDSDTVGANRQAYIRGDRTKEVNQTGGIFRERSSRLGDIVNSNIWYTGKPASGYTDAAYATFRGTGTGGLGGRAAMVYVGANDGMLHGIDTATGDEKIAYIPQGIAQGNLRRLTYTNYTHQYYVDGSPFTGDAYLTAGSTTSWKTVLFGSLGAGGKGYFVLDVTNPANFSASNASSIVMMDTTASSDEDIGYIVSPPVVDDAVTNKSRQIVKLNNGRWAIVVGNGINSTNEAPVLLIQYLDGDKAIKKLSPCGVPVSSTCGYKGSNGLSAPQLVDLNGDGKVDVAYAGDIKGNLWKFNMGATSDTSWVTAFSNEPYFVANRSSKAQSITTAPYWMAHPQGGIMIAIGTGQNLTDNDQTDTNVQSYYAVWDNSTFAASSGGVTITDAAATINTASNPILTKLQEQTVSSTPTAVDGTNYYTSSNNSFSFGSGTGQKMGWYLDWPIEKQRVLTNTRLFSGQKILVQTTVPKTGSASNVETCSPSATAERSFQSVLNMFYGTRPETAPFTSLDNGVNILSNATMVESGAGDTTLIRTDTKIKLLTSNCPAGTSCAPKDFIPGDAVGVRASWRHVLK